ncbi:MAG: S1 RNA-binding domain-containing protein [Bacteroidota bacterium]|nr:S1 RNA-binding domain-containing protein [Bacteroidota bacterium]
MEHLVATEPPIATPTDISEEAPANQDSSATRVSDPAEPTAAASTPAADPLEWLREKMRTKESVPARIVKWQRNGLEVEIEGSNGNALVMAFMPNDNIDRDPNRTVANYFGKTVPVQITNVRASTLGDERRVTVSHRAVIEEELRNAGRERMKDVKVGDVIEVKVKSFSKDNVLVDLGPGIDAVIRLRDLSWQHFEHPYEILKRGELVQAKVISLDRGRRHVQLSIRHLTPDPELEQYDEYKPEQVLDVKVATIGTHGAEIELPNGLIGFLPMSEIAWERINSVNDVLSVGDELKVRLLTVDPADRRITASRKLLIENPARIIESTFRPNTDHDGTIKEVTRGGLVVALAHGAEGFIPRRELSHDRIERLEDVFKAGKPLEGLRVIEFDRRGNRDGGPRITLSLIAAEREAQRTTLREYRAAPNESRYSLSDSLAALKAQLEAQGN